MNNLRPLGFIIFFGLLTFAAGATIRFGEELRGHVIPRLASRYETRAITIVRVGNKGAPDGVSRRSRILETVQSLPQEELDFLR